MPIQRTIRILLILGAWGLLLFFSGPAASAQELLQQPTGSIATVTSTVSGPSVIVNADQDQINVRSGPSTNYPQVGVLVAGQEVVGLGRTTGGDWIQIVYPGVPGGVAWVYSGLVTVGTGNLPVVEPPPTPTPQTTPTVDPTLAAQFIIESTPTRLPTFTPPPALAVPTFQQPAPLTGGGGNIPMGIVIMSLGVVGVFGFFISLLRRNR